MEGTKARLERLDAVEDSSVVLYDLYQRKYVFLTSSFKFLLGYDREQALGQGPEYFYRCMPEEDLGTVLDTVTRMLGLVAVGPASREIADRLYISTATVNNHHQRILSKTGARNSTEAVRYAARLGIL
jgi:DNA-binding CsgD family transcriptional regulator